MKKPVCIGCDIHECPKCERRISVFGNHPIMEDFQDGFNKFIENIEQDENKTVITFW